MHNISDRISLLVFFVFDTQKSIVRQNNERKIILHTKYQFVKVLKKELKSFSFFPHETVIC